MVSHEKLKKLMSDREYTQRSLAKFMNIDETTVSHFMNHDTNMRSKRIIKICQFLDCKPEEILVDF